MIELSTNVISPASLDVEDNHLTSSVSIASPHSDLWIGERFLHSHENQLARSCRTLYDIAYFDDIVPSSFESSLQQLKSCSEPSTRAVVHRFVINKFEVLDSMALAISTRLSAKNVSSKSPIVSTSFYCRKYFPRVYEGLRKHRLDIYVDLPNKVKQDLKVEHLWVPYEEIWNNRYIT